MYSQWYAIAVKTNGDGRRPLCCEHKLVNTVAMLCAQIREHCRYVVRTNSCTLSLCCAHKLVNTVHFQFLLISLRVINKNISTDNFITHIITIYNTVYNFKQILLTMAES